MIAYLEDQLFLLLFLKRLVLMAVPDYGIFTRNELRNHYKWAKISLRGHGVKGIDPDLG